MELFHPQHKQLITDLIKEHVKFILVGGYAVNLHGYIRTTHDMDIWLEPSNDNKQKLVQYLGKCGFDPEGLNYISRQNFEEHFVFHIGEQPLVVDFITRISGVEFHEADAQKVMLPMGDLFVPVLHLHHLVLSKTGTGRPQDVADIQILQEIAGNRRDE
jgi:hypothetical protein